MNKKQLVKLGSVTAKSGFKNEQDVVDKFNLWKSDELAQGWLRTMGYMSSEIEYVKAVKIIGHYKADVQVRVRIFIKSKSQEDLLNLQVKLVSNSQGFNQIDKRWIDKYVELWNIPSDVVLILKKFTGEIGLNRQLLTDLNIRDKKLILNFFNRNKILIVSDLLKGRGEFSADWILVILKTNNTTKWVLKSINEAMNVFGNGVVRITPQGSLKIGNIGMQRKGGDNGRETSKMLQFKVNPVVLFNGI